MAGRRSLLHLCSLQELTEQCRQAATYAVNPPHLWRPSSLPLFFLLRLPLSPPDLILRALASTSTMPANNATSAPPKRALTQKQLDAIHVFQVRCKYPDMAINHASKEECIAVWKRDQAAAAMLDLARVPAQEEVEAANILVEMSKSNQN
ncbi:Hypothetical protein D9617_19g103270 [Elsinoe fawcettii]|nr:Hypothetical protein D9617_19g103270 [Elsinoe fawcettii]